MINVFALFFSPTQNTMKATRAIATGIAKVVSDNDFFSIDLTGPDSRDGVYSFGPDDVIVLGMPTYAGRIPNKIEPYVSSSIYGEGAGAVPVVTYGNRNFDDALKELAYILNNNGMHVLHGAAVPSEHAFTSELAAGRPNDDDIAKLIEFGIGIGKEIANGTAKKINIEALPGHDENNLQYYKPLTASGEPANFLKAMPVTDMSRCKGCGECKYACPMDCFKTSVSEPEGTCIKCHACIKVCPNKAKSFDNDQLASHIKMITDANRDKEMNISLF